MKIEQPTNAFQFLNQICLLVLTSLAFSCTSPTPFQELLETQGRQYDLLVRNGQVLDGLDSIPRLADVLIRNDTILFLGEVDTASIVVESVIDASGKYVTPGFIDTHAHGNPLETLGFENFLAMGVTTICLGQDGDSPEYEDIRHWMDKVDSVGPGVNVALFAGHGTLRQLRDRKSVV